MRATCKKIFGIALVLCLPLLTIAKETNVSLKLRGVYDAKISLSAHNGIRFAKALQVLPDVKSGQEVMITIPDSLLPGEFLFRFDYRAKQEDHPYPGETQIYLNRESIEMDVNPKYLHGDSLILKNDRENKLWLQFMQQSSQKRMQLDLLAQFLQGYTHTHESVYRKAVKSFGKKRTEFNQWVDSIGQQNKDLYVSHLFAFSKMQPVDWTANPKERMLQQGRTFFDKLNLQDTLVLRSRQMNQFMGAYMGLFGQLSTTEALRDSLFSLAGKMACQKAQTAHPLVYGWIVDYFYNGYETYNISKGLQMLGEHIKQPNCLTTKRREIERRLQGIKTLTPGVKAPLLAVHDSHNKEMTLDWKAENKDYHLLLFYESECGHCHELMTQLREWMQNPDNSLWMDVISIGLDDKREDWAQASEKNKFPWKDYHAEGGVNSQAAASYYVLSTPSLFVVDSKGILQATPNSIGELNQFLHGEN
jgi:thiol-disulfide isomerase/thioredoxin